MIDATRHLSIFNPLTFRHPVHVIGCGGMGSRVAEGLARMGVGIPGQSPIHLYDDDMFEAHNIANQWIDIAYINEWKAEQVASNMRKLNPKCDITSHIIKVKDFINLTGIVFMCVDSMEARRIIMENVVEENLGVVCVIETRMDAETGISHCFDPHDKKQSDCWWLYWHSDEEADNIGGCSQPQSIISAIYGTTMLALKQFEQFARIDSTFGLSNRVYFDYATFVCLKEQWPHLTQE
jgi:molybdopterin/thiamine biosynthesis adenylyltransferase